MNREEILAMEAGNELDALVATEVMGWERKDYGYTIVYWEENDEDVHMVELWKPSTDIADAWKVVEKMVDKYFMVDVTAVKGGQYECVITSEEPTIHNDYELYELGETAPLAICRVALLAVMEGA